MVKVKIIKSQNQYDERYVGGVYEALKMLDFDNSYYYIVKVSDELAIQTSHDYVEEIEEITKPTNRILMVEDGSVDVDELAEWCEEQGIKLIVYRQGSNKPEFLI